MRFDFLVKNLADPVLFDVRVSPEMGLLFSKAGPEVAEITIGTLFGDGDVSGLFSRFFLEIF